MSTSSKIHCLLLRIAVAREPARPKRERANERNEDKPLHPLFSKSTRAQNENERKRVNAAEPQCHCVMNGTGTGAKGEQESYGARELITMTQLEFD